LGGSQQDETDIPKSDGYIGVGHRTGPFCQPLRHIEFGGKNILCGQAQSDGGDWEGVSGQYGA
jgi:hypothetical protein